MGYTFVCVGAVTTCGVGELGNVKLIGRYDPQSENAAVFTITSFPSQTSTSQSISTRTPSVLLKLTGYNRCEVKGTDKKRKQQSEL